MTSSRLRTSPNLSYFSAIPLPSDSQVGCSPALHPLLGFGAVPQHVATILTSEQIRVTPSLLFFFVNLVAVGQLSVVLGFGAVWQHFASMFTSAIMSHAAIVLLFCRFRCGGAAQPGSRLSDRPAALCCNSDFGATVRFVEIFALFCRLRFRRAAKPAVRQLPNLLLALAVVWQHFVTSLISQQS